MPVRAKLSFVGRHSQVVWNNACLTLACEKGNTWKVEVEYWLHCTTSVGILYRKKLCPVAFPCGVSVKCCCLHISRPPQEYEIRRPAPVFAGFVFPAKPPDTHFSRLGSFQSRSSQNTHTKKKEKSYTNADWTQDFWSACTYTNRYTIAVHSDKTSNILAKNSVTFFFLKRLRQRQIMRQK